MSSLRSDEIWNAVKPKATRPTAIMIDRTRAMFIFMFKGTDVGGCWGIKKGLRECADVRMCGCGCVDGSIIRMGSG